MRRYDGVSDNEGANIGAGMPPQEEAERTEGIRHSRPSAGDDEQISEFSDEDEVSIAQEIASIADRMEKNVFPAVLVCEQQSISGSDASEILAWAQKEEAVKLQSYINEKWKEFRTGAEGVKGLNKPESVFRAQWARDNYYTCMKQF